MKSSLSTPVWLAGNQAKRPEDIGTQIIHTRRVFISRDGEFSSYEVEAIFDYDQLLKETLERKKTGIKPDLVETEFELEELGEEVIKHKRCVPTETWASRWVAAPLAYLFPKKRREEWLGDLYEANLEMLHDGYPRWMVNLNNFLRTVILLASSLNIKLSDLISWGLGRIK